MINAQSPPLSQVGLDKFLGLYTEASPESLPEGTSPLAINDDFVVGGVLPRPGKENVYQLSIFGYAGLGTDAGDSTGGGYKFVQILYFPGGHSAQATITNTAGNLMIMQVTISDGGATYPTVVDTQGNNWKKITIGLDGGNLPTSYWYAFNIKGGPNTITVTNPSTFNFCLPIVSEYSGFGNVDPLDNFVIAASTIPLTTGAPNCLIFSGIEFPNNSNPTSIPGFTQRFSNAKFLCQDQLAVSAGTTVVADSIPGVGSGTVNFTASFATVGGLGAWTNPNNVAGAPSGVYATIALSHGQQSDGLNCTDYGFALQNSQGIDSINVNVTAGLSGFGFPGWFLDCSLIYQGTVIAQIFPTAIVLPNGVTDTIYTFSITNAAVGGVLTPLVVNDASFGVQLRYRYTGTIGNPRTGRVAGAQIQVVSSGNPALDFNYVKTFEQEAGEVNTLALDDTGTLWQEDVINNPGVLKNIYSAIEPDTFANSTTLDNREFIAFSNLLNGTDIPRAYNGTNLDRLSQVGPGAPPSASISAGGSTVLSISQAPPTQIRRIVWGASTNAINDSTKGNILVIYGEGKTPGNIFQTLPNAVVGGTIVLSGLPPTFPLKNDGSLPYNLNGTYQILSVGTAVVGGTEVVPVFTVQAPAIQYGYSNDFGSGGTPTSGWFYQATLATMTTATQVPNLEVGNTFQLAGTGGAPPAGYDGSWTVIDTPNAAQLQITSTQLAGGVATYGFNLITGANPAIGEAVTISQTLNGNGIFNIVGGVITNASPGTFSINIPGADVASAAESGAGIIFGTIFTFDPLVIVGPKSGGTIVTSGVIAAGIRKVCYSFLTRSGYMTQPSPIFTFDVPSGASAIVIGNLLPGPDDVIARVIHLTAAEGDNFYNIPVPVTVIDNGVNVVNSSTWVNDNTSLNAVLSFSDGVLLTATSIDTSGNNLFETIELGAPLALVAYSERLFALGEQNKVTNFLNYSFDGGFASTPPGWNVDSTSGDGGSLVNSPIFGFAYSIAFNGGGASGKIGMITQPAFQDEFEVAIINPSTTYSVRVTLETVNEIDPLQPGNLFVDLFSPSAGLPIGVFSINLLTLSQKMQIVTGKLLTTAVAPVPKDLILRLYGSGFSAGTQIVIDRVEVFPTEKPNLSTQLTGSYQGNFEAFDKVEGVVNAAQQNQQPVESAFKLYDTLYMVKSGSLVSTQDNKTTQPSQWPTPRTVSNLVGTTSVNGVDSGEEYAIIAGQPGGFIFNGGEPIKLTEEIQSLWNQINWAYGHTLWVKNDITNRRIYFGVPLKSRDADGNIPVWLPAGLIADDQNPTTPNVVIVLNYKQLTTAAAVADRPEAHVSSFGGKLISTDMSRKWSIWTIKAPCADFIKRPDKTSPLFLGNSDETGKIYQLTPGLLEDDGVAFNQIWTSHGFPTPEQEEGLKLFATRKVFDFMQAIVDGSGELQVDVFPNTMDSPYAHSLLPNFDLASLAGGDTEIPVNETGNRLFVKFSTNAVGAGFNLSKLMLAMRADPWSPVRGRNN